MSSTPTKQTSSTRRARVVVIGWCAVLFFTALLVYTRHNTFPVIFHPDEAPKATRVLNGQPSYRQPLLLANATAIALGLTSQARSVERTVFTGRLISAAFASGAVVLLSLFAFAVERQSIRAAIAVGVAAFSCPQLLLLAHYMKEDTALVFAAAAFLVALWRHECVRTERSALLLGVAAGVVGAAKYIGLVAIPVGSWLIGRQHSPENKRPGRAFAIGVVLSWCTVNYLAVAHPLRFLSSLWYEVGHPVAGHYGLADGILLWSPVWRILGAEVNPLVAALALIYLLTWLRNWRRGPRAVAIFVIGPVVCLISLSVSRFVLDRHLLPVTLAIYTMAGFAVFQTTELLTTAGARWGITLLFAAALGATTISRDRAIFHELQNETRLQLRTWIRNNLPRTAVIAEDRPAHLEPRDGRFLPADRRLMQKVLTPTYLFVTDLGSLADLRGQGVTHVVTCDEAYGRLRERHPATAAARTQYQQRRERYEEIFSSAKLLFEAKPVRPVGGNTSPIVSVYAIQF